MAGSPAQPAPAGHLQPLLHIGKWLLADFLSTFAFVILYAATHSIPVATGLAIAIGLGQVAVLHIRGTPIDLMQWMGLALVVVLGGATLLTGSPVLIMLKPTLIYAAIGAVMLRPGWMRRYAPPIASARAGDVLKAFGYLWAALFLATSAANLFLALYASPAVWLWFIGVFPLASKLGLVAAQYVVIRSVVRRRVRAVGGVAYSGP